MAVETTEAFIGSSDRRPRHQARGGAASARVAGSSPSARDSRHALSGPGGDFGCRVGLVLGSAVRVLLCSCHQVFPAGSVCLRTSEGPGSSPMAFVAHLLERGVEHPQMLPT